MCHHVLVAFGSRFGSTADVAEAIGMCLEQVSAFADVSPVNEVHSLDRYDAVILGSAIRDGAWLPEVVQFLDTHREALNRIPVAYFCVCMTLRDDTPDTRRIVASYHDPLLRDYPYIIPVSIGMFAGALEYEHLPPLARVMAKAIDFPEGDFRNWSAVCDWTVSVIPQLISEPIPL